MSRLAFHLTRLLAFTYLAATSPLQGKIEQRDVTTTSTITRTSTHTETLTSWVPPLTTIFNPRDFTTWVDFGFGFTEWPSIVTSWFTSSCVTYSYIWVTPPPTSTEVTWVTKTITTTRTGLTTVTITDSDYPTRTVTSLTFSTVTESTARTDWSTKCTNTLVESQYISSTRTITTMPWAKTRERATTTEVCLYSLGISLTVNGPWPTPEPYIPGISRFTGDTTLITIKQGATIDELFEVTGDTLTIWTTVCNNPSSSYTRILYSQTVTPSPVTATVTRMGCDSSSGASTGAVAVAAHDRRTGPESGAGAVARARQETGATATAAPTTTTSMIPARVETTTYKTVGLQDGTVVTGTATKVIGWYTMTMVTEFNRVVTVTAPVSTAYVSVCSG